MSSIFILKKFFPGKEKIASITKVENLIQSLPDSVVFDLEEWRTVAGGRTTNQINITKKSLLMKLDLFTIGGGSYNIIHKTYDKNNSKGHIINITQKQKIPGNQDVNKSFPPSYSIKNFIYIKYNLPKF